MAIKRFREQLRQQLSFLENSCVAFDGGQPEEAIRIAVSLRVLFHDTRKQTSLLTHLGATGIELTSTCPIHTTIPYDMSFESLCGFSSVAGITAKLGNSSTLHQMPALDWWGQFVIGLGKGRNLSRKIIALTAADKDGGAHVDEKLPDEYELLALGLWEQHAGGKSGRVPGHQLIYLRQMGYEVLTSPKLREAAA
jgi:hypothetical protein